MFYMATTEGWVDIMHAGDVKVTAYSCNPYGESLLQL